MRANERARVRAANFQKRKTLASLRIASCFAVELKSFRLCRILCYHSCAVKRVSKFAPYLILCVGFALRLFRLGANSLWYDETVSLLLARADLAELIRHTAGDIHPPLYYLLLHFWIRLAGWSEFSAAFLSLWFGALLVALVYRATREWLGARGIACVAALLVAVSPYNIWYSQEVRMYTVGATLGLLSVYFLRRMLTREKIFTRDFFAYALFTALGFYTLYYFVFLMVFQWLWVAYRAASNAKRQACNANGLPRAHYRLPLVFLLSQLALVLLYLPWFAIAFRQALDPPVPPWREFTPLPRVLLETFSALLWGQSVDPITFAPLTLLALLPIGVWLWRATQAAINKQKAAFGYAVSPWFLFAYTFIPLATLYLFSLWKPLYHARYIFTYAPAFYILAAGAWVFTASSFMKWFRARRDNLAIALAALALLIGLGFTALTGYSLYNFWFNPQYAEDDLRGAVNYIAERWRPGDVILVNAGYAYPALEYYFPAPIERERLVVYRAQETDAPLVLQTGSIGGAQNLGWGDPRSDFYATTADETRAALDRVSRNYARVWMLRIYDTVVDPHGVIRDYFNTRAVLFDDQVFGGEAQTRAQGFIMAPPRALPERATRVNQNLGERVELVGYEIGARALRRGEFFDAALYWKLAQAVNYNYQVTLQLLNANGENVAQTDEMPLGQVLPMTRWQTDILYREPLRLKIPETLAAGAYRAIVKLYEPRSGEILGEPVELGAVQIR